MRAIVVHDHRFVDDNGEIFTANESGAGYKFFRRYLEVFDEICVIGRAGNGTRSGKFKVTGDGIKFEKLPYYHGPKEYCRQYFDISKRIDQILHQKSGDAFIFRMPGTIGSMFVKKINSMDYPFAMEVVTDPYEVFAPGAVRHPLRPLFRQWFSRLLKKQCQQAAAVSYVTESILQQRYPAARHAFTTHYSSIQLTQEAFIDTPRQFAGTGGKNLVTVGTMDQLYKAQDVLIDAVHKCLSSGLDLRLTLVGDGTFRPLLQNQVEKLGLQERVRFTGRLPSGRAVRDELDRADLFVLPSKGEGLPRAMIEAMARGLPCVGSSASGIPEILAPENMVPPADSGALASKIAEVLTNHERMVRMSSQNLIIARRYGNELLQERRLAFYNRVKEMTAHHIRERGALIWPG